MCILLKKKVIVVSGGGVATRETVDYNKRYKAKMTLDFSTAVTTLEEEI